MFSEDAPAETQVDESAARPSGKPEERNVARLLSKGKYKAFVSKDLCIEWQKNYWNKPIQRCPDVTLFVEGEFDRVKYKKEYRIRPKKFSAIYPIEVKAINDDYDKASKGLDQIMTNEGKIVIANWIKKEISYVFSPIEIADSINENTTGHHVQNPWMCYQHRVQIKGTNKHPEVDIPIKDKDLLEYVFEKIDTMEKNEKQTRKLGVIKDFLDIHDKNCLGEIERIVYNYGYESLSKDQKDVYDAIKKWQKNSY